MRISWNWLRPLGNAHVACLLLLCQGFKWLSGNSVWLVFRRSWVRISAGSRALASLSKEINIHGAYTFVELIEIFWNLSICRSADASFKICPHEDIMLTRKNSILSMCFIWCSQVDFCYTQSFLLQCLSGILQETNAWWGLGVRILFFCKYWRSNSTVSFDFALTCMVESWLSLILTDASVAHTTSCTNVEKDI